MRILGILLGLATLVLLEGLTTSCQAPTQHAATTADSFSITGTLVENTCAPGLDPREMLGFVAELRRQDGVGYWRQDGGAIVSGTMSPSGEFRFLSRTEIPAYGPDPDFGTPGCSLYQTETISGVLVTRDTGDGGSDDGSIDAAQDDDAGVDGSTGDAGPSASFSGTNTIVISATPSSDCSRLLASGGGDFPSFPCQASYALSGVAR
jgi:hypothetical protein